MRVSHRSHWSRARRLRTPQLRRVFRIGRCIPDPRQHLGGDQYQSCQDDQKRERVHLREASAPCGERDPQTPCNDYGFDTYVAEPSPAALAGIRPYDNRGAQREYEDQTRAGAEHGSALLRLLFGATLCFALHFLNCRRWLGWESVKLPFDFFKLTCPIVFNHEGTPGRISLILMTPNPRQGQRNAMSSGDEAKVRLDKWLWAARFFKTRSLAADAIEKGKVELNGERAKRAKQLQAGDSLRIRLGPYHHIVTVRALSERRGPASVAATLYEESAEGRRAREAMQLQVKVAQSVPGYERGRPTKKDRRDIEKMRRREAE